VRTLVIVPTYNERPNIEVLLTRLLRAIAHNTDVLVVDDGSPDRTGDAVQAMATNSPSIELMQRGRKLGLASAYVSGFKLALERGYDAVVEIDADLSHDPAVVPQLLTALEEADLAIGSRYVPGGRIENWGALRRILSRAGNVYARAWLGFGIRDSTSGFRAYRRKTIEAEDLDGIRSEGYGFQIEMTHRVFLKGGRITEIPITFTERTHGWSKLSRRIVFEALLSVPVWGIRHRLARRRSKAHETLSEKRRCR
jgi:dolichol-phosphate mannosyltransferase